MSPNLDLDKGAKELTSHLRKKKLVIFVGSGVSIAAGLPSWDGPLLKFLDFCEKLQEKLDPKYKFSKLIEDARKESNRRYPTRIASALKHQLIEIQNSHAINVSDLFQDWMDDMFSVETPHSNHRLIVRTNFPFILTSNYDRLLEKAADDENFFELKMRSFTFKQPEKVAMAVYGRDPAIIHIHGNKRDLALDDFVFTAEDYVRIRNMYPGFTMALQSIFMNFSVLFLGYGGSDPHLEDFIEQMCFGMNWVKSESLPSYFLVLRKDKVDQVLTKYKDRLRTRLIVLDNYDQTALLLRRLQKACPRK